MRDCTVVRLEGRYGLRCECLVELSSKLVNNAVGTLGGFLERKKISIVPLAHFYMLGELGLNGRPVLRNCLLDVG